VPNGQILRVANKSQAWARAVLDLEVDAGTDYDVAAAVIQRVADQLSADPGFAADIIDTPEVWGIESFTDGGYTIRLVLKTRPAAQFRVMRELRIRYTEAFREAGIVPPGGGRSELWVHDADRADEAASADATAAAGPNTAHAPPEPEGPTIPEPPRSPAKGDPAEG
jgi:small conductance mechanosensitive channel